MQSHRVGCYLVRCGGQRWRRGPAASAGLASLASDAMRRHRVGCYHVLCGGQRVRRGPAASAGLTFLASDAMQRHRAQGLAVQWASHPLQTRWRQADVPGASPGLAPLTGDVATGHRAGCEQVPCSRPCVQGGPAVPADLTSPTSVAAQSCGDVHVLCSLQCVRKGPAASPGITSHTSGAALCPRAVHDHVLVAISAGVKRPAKSALGSPRGSNAGPTLISMRGSTWLAAARASQVAFAG